MLKHVHLSPMKKGADTISVCSSTSFTSSLYNSLGGSGEFSALDCNQLKSSSRSSSVSSLPSLTVDSGPQVILKVYTACLQHDIEYKTLNVSWDTNAAQVVKEVLRKCKVKHRDPKLFYLTMEMRYRRADKSCSIVLEKNSKPAMLQALHPPGESEFHLKIKTGGLIKIFTNSLNTETQYRNLLISDETTSDEVIQLLLNFFNMKEPLEEFSIYQVCPNQEYQRKLHPDDIPLREQLIRISKGDFCHFIIRRAHHRPVCFAPASDDSFNISLATTKDICQRLQRNSKPLNWTTSSVAIEPPTYSSLALLKSKFNKLESCFSKLTLRNQMTNNLADLNEKRFDVNANILTSSDEMQDDQFKRQSRNHKAFSTADCSSFSYNPVYNVREIKFSENSF